MSERLRWFWGGAWLATNFFLLALPVFLPSYPHSLLTPISISTAAMFTLSFPASVIALVLSPVAELIFGVDAHSIGGLYFNLNMIFLLGAVQWFWVVPHILRRNGKDHVSETAILPEYIPPVDVEAFDSESRTPVERVFDDEK